MKNDNLTNEQFEFLKDLFVILSSNEQNDINKDNILNKLQDEIILTMKCYWQLVDEINDLKQILNNQI